MFLTFTELESAQSLKTLKQSFLIILVDADSSLCEAPRRRRSEQCEAAIVLEDLLEMEIKLAIGSKAEKRTFKHLVSGADSEKLHGKKIGNSFRGEIIGLNGYELEITGGSDSSGFPMRKDIAGPGRKKVVLTRSLGFNSKRKGQRKRRSIRGNTISADTAQINCKVVKAGSKPISTILGGAKEPTAKSSQLTAKEIEKDISQPEQPEKSEEKEEKEHPKEEAAVGEPAGEAGGLASKAKDAGDADKSEGNVRQTVRGGGTSDSSDVGESQIRGTGPSEEKAEEAEPKEKQPIEEKKEEPEEKKE